MEDNDFETATKHRLRRIALEHAISHVVGQGVPVTPTDVTTIAETFFQFLKGDNK